MRSQSNSVEKQKFTGKQFFSSNQFRVKFFSIKVSFTEFLWLRVLIWVYNDLTRIPSNQRPVAVAKQFYFSLGKLNLARFHENSVLMLFYDCHFVWHKNVYTTTIKRNATKFLIFEEFDGYTKDSSIISLQFLVSR